MGGLATIWIGSALDCPSANDEIVSLHSRFLYNESVDHYCNNGAIVARSLSVEGNNYTSQLTVTVTPDTAGKAIKCAGDNGESNTLFFSSIIPAITGLSPCMHAANQQPHCCPSLPLLFTIGPFHPPNINNVDYSSTELTFAWSPVAPDCPAIHYKILASNCGSCPNTTNHNAVPCTDVSTDGSECTFAVQTVICGNITGNASNPFNITFYATEPSMTATTNIKHPTENLSIYANTAAYIISIGSLVIALIASVAVSITVIVIILRRSQAEINAALELSNRSTHNEPTYEDVTDPLPSVGTIDTQDNVAYGHTKTTATYI